MGQAGASPVVPVDHTVADEDPGASKAVVVAVDGADGVVVLGDIGRVLNDVCAELVAGERRPQVRSGAEDDVGDVVRDGVRSAAGCQSRHHGVRGGAVVVGVVGNDGRDIGDGGCSRLHDQRIDNRAGLCSLVCRDIGDLDVIDDETIQRPVGGAADTQQEGQNDRENPRSDPPAPCRRAFVYGGGVRGGPLRRFHGPFVSVLHEGTP